MNRVFELQRALLRVIDKYAAEIPDERRDQPADWERVHMASAGRMGSILAEKRGEDPEIAACACSVHDFGRILTGKQPGHAEAGYEPVREFLRGLGLFTEDEIEEIALAVRHHSEKAEVGTPLQEIVKDADILDFYQYGYEFQRQEQKDRLTKLIRKEES